MRAHAYDVRVDGAAYIRSHALAEPGYEIKAPRSGHGEHAGHAEQAEKISVDVRCIGLRETEVDQVAKRHRHDERRARRNGEHQKGQRKLFAVGVQERPQAAEQRQRGRFDRALGIVWHRRQNPIRVAVGLSHYPRGTRGLLFRPLISEP